jgi:[ribosomal protein S18]-alanine N-acetyltransferase
MFNLRKYHPSEFEVLWDLDQRCFSPEIAYSRPELAHYLAHKRAICLVARCEDKIVGFVLAHHDRRGFGHIVTLDVDPAQRRSGLGSTLIQAIETRCRDLDLTSVFLEVAVNNRTALCFYEKHGYSVLKTLRRYYPGDLDGLLMGKKLRERRGEKRS